MTMLRLWLFSSVAVAQLTAPAMPREMTDLRDAFVASTDENKRLELLAEVSRLPPGRVADIQALFDLFMRFPQEPVRKAALDSLELLDPRRSDFEPLFLAYIDQPEPEAQFFGIRGALRLRSEKALPAITKIARRRFAFKSPRDAALLSEKNAWWIQYEALAALAQWQGAKALDLLVRKSREAPRVARLMGLYLWKDSLPQMAKWSASSVEDLERADQALTAPTATANLRVARADMLKIMRDPQAPKELRHQVALKLGLSSTAEEVAELLKEHEAAADAQTKLFLMAALFASRDRQVIPLLMRTAKDNPDPRTRAGARVELKDLLKPSEYREVAAWAAQNETDPENKQAAEKELKDLGDGGRER